MKATKQAKGLVDYSDKYNPTIPPDEYPEPSAEEILAQEQQHEAELREQEENARVDQDWEALGKRNFEILKGSRKAIGQRLTYLFEEKKIERTHFARQIGVSRSTLFRYCMGKNAPNPKKLLVIIDALDMTVADFCYAPKDLEKWKASLEKKPTQKNDIFDLRDNLLGQLCTNDFTYQYKGETIRLPHRHYVILKAMVESSFRILDLISHDKESADTEE